MNKRTLANMLRLRFGGEWEISKEEINGVLKGTSINFLIFDLEKLLNIFSENVDFRIVNHLMVRPKLEYVFGSFKLDNDQETKWYFTMRKLKDDDETYLTFKKDVFKIKNLLKLGGFVLFLFYFLTLILVYHNFSF